MSETERPDFSEIPDEAVDEICRNGELILQNMLQIALGADQRATSTAGIFGAGSVALFAAAVTLGTSEVGNPAFMWSAIVTAALLFIASALAAWGAYPVKFFISGHEPALLVQGTSDPVWMKRYLCEDIQVRINANRVIVRNANRKLKAGLLFAAAAIPIGIAVYLALALA